MTDQLPSPYDRLPLNDRFDLQVAEVNETDRTAKCWIVPRIDTDTRCTHHDAAGQCLDHQGHTGECQFPQADR